MPVSLLCAAEATRAALAPAPGGATALRALCIGIDRYDNLRGLTRATGDARAIADRIESFGYSAIRSIDPSLAALKGDFTRFLAGVTPNSSVFLFFAGHGFEVAGANYLTARDTANHLGGFFDTVVPVGGLLDQIAAKGPRQAFVVLDACRDNPLPSGTLGQGRGFVSSAAPGGFYIVYSAGSGETALDDLGEDDRCGNGLFTRALLGRMNRSEPFDAIVKSTRTTVTTLATSIGHAQHPGIYDQTQQELTLDGQAGRAVSAPAPAGRMASSRALLIAAPDAGGMRMQAPARDVQRVGTVLTTLGAATTVLTSPTLAEVRAALATLAAATERNLLVYFSGMTIYQGEAASEAEEGDKDLFFLFRDSVVDGAARRASTVGLDDLYRLLRREGRTITILSDGGFGPGVIAAADLGVGSGPVGASCAIRRRLRVLGELDRGQVSGPGDEEDRRYGDVALLFSSSVGKQAIDQAEGLPHSPFAIAVANGLARPGLSVKDFSRLVRNEVEDITGAAQIPQLVATPSARVRVVVEPRTVSADDPAMRCVAR